MMMTAVPVHRYHSNIIRPLFSTLRIVPLVLCLHSKWSAPVSFCVEACFDQTEGDVPICGHVGCGTMSMSGMRRHETAVIGASSPRVCFNYVRYILQRGRCANMWTSGVQHNVNEWHETAVIGASSPRVCFNYLRYIIQRGRCANMWTSGVRHTVNERHEMAVIGAL